MSGRLPDRKEPRCRPARRRSCMLGCLDSQYHLPAVVVAVELETRFVEEAAVMVESVDEVCGEVLVVMLAEAVSDGLRERLYRASRRSNTFGGTRGHSRRPVFVSVNAAAIAVVSCLRRAASPLMRLLQ